MILYVLEYLGKILNSIIREREYDVTQGNEESEIIYFTANPNSESEMVTVNLHSSVRARNIGKDILAIFRMIAGGEVSEYSKLLNESRDQALQRMVDSATKLNANAIISTRIVTSTVASGAAEILCYGTAVKIELEN